MRQPKNEGQTEQGRNCHHHTPLHRPCGVRKQVVQALKPGWGTQRYLRGLSFSRLKNLLGWQPVGHFMWLHEHHFLSLLLVTPFPSLCSSPSWGRGLTALHLMTWAWGWEELGPGSWLSPHGKATPGTHRSTVSGGSFPDAGSSDG